MLQTFQKEGFMKFDIKIYLRRLSDTHH